MAKHFKPSFLEAPEAVSGNLCDDLCEDVIREILSTVQQHDPGSFAVQQFICKPFRHICTTLHPSAPIPTDNPHPANLFVYQAFVDGDLHRIRWACSRGLRSPTPWMVWPSAGWGWCNDDLRWLHVHDAHCPNISPYHAAAAIHPDGRGDAAFQWYVDTFFIPEIRGASQAGPRTADDYYYAVVGSGLVLAAAARGRLDLAQYLMACGARVGLSYRNYGLFRAAAADDLPAISFFVGIPIADSYRSDAAPVVRDQPDDLCLPEVVRRAGQNGRMASLAFLLRLAGEEFSTPASALAEAAFTAATAAVTVATVPEPLEFRILAISCGTVRDAAYCGAAAGGHIAALNSLRQHLPLPLTQTVLSEAVCGGHLDALQWVLDRLPRSVVEDYIRRKFWTDNVQDFAPCLAGLGWIHREAAAFDLLLAHGKPADPVAAADLAEELAGYAASWLRPSLLAVLHRHGLPVSYTSLWPSLDWADEYGSPVPHVPFLLAAIVWLVRHGAVMDPKLYHLAAETGQVGVAHWLRDVAQCPGYESAAAYIQRIVDQNPDDPSHVLLPDQLRSAHEIAAAIIPLYKQ